MCEAGERQHSVCTVQYTESFHMSAHAFVRFFVCFICCVLSTIKQVAPHPCATRLWSPAQRKRSYNYQVPSWPFWIFIFALQCRFSRLVSSLYFIWTPLFPDLALPLPPWAVWLGISPRLVHFLSPSHHGHLGGLFSFMHVVSPREVPPSTPPCPPCPTPLKRGLWQPGKGMSQKKNMMPHGKLYLFPPNTYLKEMSQAYPENPVAAPLPTPLMVISQDMVDFFFNFITKKSPWNPNVR